MPQNNKFVWTKASSEAFANAINSNGIKQDILNFHKSEFAHDVKGINECTSKIETIMCKTANQSLKRKRNSKNTPKQPGMINHAET